MNAADVFDAGRNFTRKSPKRTNSITQSAARMPTGATAHDATSIRYDEVKFRAAGARRPPGVDSASLS
jgi:hypothetical protein